MSLFKRKDSSFWWVKIALDGRKLQRSSGTDDKIKAQEFHDRLKAQMWEQNRIGVKAQRSWKEAVVRWLSETSEKATHKEDKRKLIWLDVFLGDKMLGEITLDVIDSIRAAKLKEAAKSTTNRYLALVRAILLRAKDEWEWIDKTPKIRLFKETASRERSLTREQAGKLLDELPDTSAMWFCSHWLRDYARATFSSWSGHRSIWNNAMRGFMRGNRRIGVQSRFRSTTPRFRCCYGRKGSIWIGSSRFRASH